MKKKTMVILLALALLIGGSAIAGTLAYFNAKTEATANTFTMGNVKIALSEVFDPTTAILVPGKTIEKEVTLKNTGSIDAYMWLEVAVPKTLNDGITLNVPAVSEGETVIVNNKEVGANIVYTICIDKTYGNNDTEKLLSSVTMKPAVKQCTEHEDCYLISEGNHYNASNFDITVTGYAIQAEGFNNITEAIAGFNS